MLNEEKKVKQESELIEIEFNRMMANINELNIDPANTFATISGIITESMVEMFGHDETIKFYDQIIQAILEERRQTDRPKFVTLIKGDIKVLTIAVDSDDESVFNNFLISTKDMADKNNLIFKLEY